jgi:hypothetical protein
MPFEGHGPRVFFGPISPFSDEVLEGLELRGSILRLERVGTGRSEEDGQGNGQECESAHAWLLCEEMHEIVGRMFSQRTRSLQPDQHFPVE